MWKDTAYVQFQLNMNERNTMKNKSRLSEPLKSVVDSGLFLEHEVCELPSDRAEWVGKYLIKDPLAHSVNYRSRKWLVWECDGGNGCEEGKISNSIYATCLADNETAKHYPYEFIGLFVGNVEIYRYECDDME